MSAANRGARRAEHDHYATPLWCVRQAVGLVDWAEVRVFCEPCKGDGRILEAAMERMPGRTPYVRWYEIREGRDYLRGRVHNGAYDLIITNPPYSHAQAFVEKALLEARTVLMLLRLNFLGSQKRASFWRTRAPSHLYVLSQRPSFTGAGTDATEYAWFGWGPDLRAAPGVYVLPPAGGEARE